MITPTKDGITENLEDDFKDLLESIEGKNPLEISANKIITQDNDTKMLIRKAKWIASYKLPVLITGPTGTGKELFARLLHGNRKGKFVAVNCGGIPDTLLESEFFGHEKGAFTGATSRREGYFEEAEGGTIFLDEIAELPRFLQCKLLRVLEDKKLRRVGGNGEIPITARIVAATNHGNLHTNEKLFRQDLYFRLAGTRLYLKSLLERGEKEIKLLWNHFTNNTLPFPEEKDDYTWPGNVRELKNLAEENLIFKDFLEKQGLE